MERSSKNCFFFFCIRICLSVRFTCSVFISVQTYMKKLKLLWSVHGFCWALTEMEYCLRTKIDDAFIGYSVTKANLFTDQILFKESKKR